jgi:RNA polymerase sigma factor (sigma-70 family)
VSAARQHRQRVADFVAQEWHRLVGAVRSWIDDEGDRDAEDIVQEVLAGLLEPADVAGPVRDLSAYVWRALRNRVIDRRRARRPPVSLDADAGGGDGAVGDTVADGRSETGALVERRTLGGRIEAAIDALGDAEREVFLATEMEGRKFRELAAAWDTPIGTLLARKHRAVVRLRAALADIDRNE